MPRYETVCEICNEEHILYINYGHAFKAKKDLKFTTFKERNNLLLEFDKLPAREQGLVISKTLGAFSVSSDSPIFWQHLEKFMKDYTSRQPSLFKGDTDTKNNSIDAFIEVILDKDIEKV